MGREKSRTSTHLQRKKGLVKKIYELTTLCDVDACMIIYGLKQGDRPIEPEVWPDNLGEAHRIINRYHQIPKEDRTKRSLHLSDFFQDGNKKMEDEFVKLGRRNNNECSTLDDRINSFTVDQLRELSDTLDTKTDLMDRRLAFLKGQDCSNFECSSSDAVTLNQNPPCPYYMPAHTTADDVLRAQPLDYMMAMDHNYPCSNHPSMIFNDAMTPMMAMNGFDYYGDFGGDQSPIRNFSHPTTITNHPFLSDQSAMMMPPMQDMEFTNRGSSSFCMQPMMMMPTPSFLQQPDLISMETSSQMDQ